VVRLPKPSFTVSSRQSEDTGWPDKPSVKLMDPIAAELAEAERRRLAGPRRASVVDHLDFPLRPWVAEPPLVSLVDGPLDTAGVRYAALIWRKNATVNVSASGTVRYGVNVPPVAQRVTL